MKIKSHKDFWSGVMFVAIGIAFAWGATEYRFGSTANPGPAYFPFGLGILLALLGSIVLFTSLTIETEGGDPIGKFNFKALLIILLAVGLFGFMLPRFGLAISLPVLVLLSASAGDEFKLTEALISCVVLTLASWAIFIWGLGLVIPLWPTIFG